MAKQLQGRISRQSFNTRHQINVSVQVNACTG